MTRRLIVLVGLAGVALLFSSRALSSLPADTLSGTWETQGPVLVLGAIVGITYGLLAAGLVLVYRTSRIINFAHGHIGAFAAAVLGLAVVRWHVPYWLAFPMALAVGGAVAAATEVLVIRRLRSAPRLMSIVATLGVGQFVVLVGFAINSQAGSGNIYPQPPGLPDFMFSGLRVSPAFSGMLLLTPVLLVALGAFLKYTRFGIGIRSASDNREAARLSGIFASRMTALAWALSGVVAAFTAVLTQPTRGFTNVDSFGPSLLLLALAAATIGRMVSIPRAVASGIILGVLEQLLRWNYPSGGAVEIMLLVVILVALLVQRQRGAREEEATSWAAVQAVRPLPQELRALWTVRNLGRIVAVVTLALAVLAPIMASPSGIVSLTAIYAYAIVALSLAVITGLGGQLTLGQFAFAAVGAVVSYHVSVRTGWFPLAFVYAGGAAAIASVLVGIPALRIRGLLVTVTTLAFALATPAALRFRWFLGDGVDPGRPIVFGNPLDTSKEYYFVGLVTLVACLALVHNVRRSGFGRRLVAVRDNEDAARAFTISTTMTKLQGFMFSGFIAGLGGAMYAHALSNVEGSTFPVTASIDIAKMAVIGGISTLSGPVLGALFVMGLPAFVPLDAAGLAASSFGQLLIIMYLPRGLVQILVPLRDQIASWLGSRAGIDVDAAFARRDGLDPTEPKAPDGNGRPKGVVVAAPRELGTVIARPPSPPGRQPPLLELRELRRSFGGVQAVDGVSFDVWPGETVGLIGPNGAGKTTTFELVGGFLRPDAGRVRYEGRDVTGLAAHARARLGLIRSFQDAALFPTMTVSEVIMLAGERADPARLASALLGLQGGERRRAGRAADVVDFMGLGRYASKPIMELSTGTRRIAELACMVALEPTLLLLDEPSSGIAQRETEALRGVLERTRQEFRMTLVVIEHDMPLIMSLANRIVVMADGRILTDGAPADVRQDSRVVEAYLGGKVEALEASQPRSQATLDPTAG